MNHRWWAALRPWYWTLIIPIAAFVIVGAGWYVGNNVLADGKDSASASALEVVGHNVTQKVTVPATTKTVAGKKVKVPAHVVTTTRFVPKNGATVLSTRTVGDTVLRTVQLPGGGTTVVTGPTRTVTTTTSTTIHDPGTTIHDPGTTVTGPTQTVTGPTQTITGPTSTVTSTVTDVQTVVSTVTETVTTTPGSGPPCSTPPC
jgi:hypothetical protein